MGVDDRNRTHGSHPDRWEWVSTPAGTRSAVSRCSCEPLPFHHTRSQDLSSQSWSPRNDLLVVEHVAPPSRMAQTFPKSLWWRSNKVFDVIQVLIFFGFFTPLPSCQHRNTLHRPQHNPDLMYRMHICQTQMKSLFLCWRSHARCPTWRHSMH